MAATTTVLVVGANRGLGLQFALQYLKKGFNVYGTYRKESASESKELLESGAKTIVLDLGDESSIEVAAKTFGDQSLDLLINCAAAGNGPPNWIDTTSDDFMHRFKISAVGPFLTTKHFYPQLKQSATPMVVNISSRSGSISGNVKGLNISYRSAKAALNMVTVDVARELAPDKIACVAMSPGWVQTKMSNWTGPGKADEAVASMLKVIDGLDFSHTSQFFHVDGQILEW